MADNEFPAGERIVELAEKQARLQRFLAENALDALLISRHENIAWATAGLVDVRIGLPRETGAASLLITRGGDRYCLTTNNEAPRLEAEEFAGLNYQPVIQPWYSNDPVASARRIVGSGKLAGDDAASGLPLMSMKPLRLSMTEGEIARYRWLGRNVADVVTEALLALRPGMTEAAMQAIVGEGLLARSIMPSVFLTAVDDRVRAYRHAVPRDGVLKRFGMLNFCARRWGLSVSITRFVHFGAMPAELEEKFAAAARVNAAMLHATREGVTANALYSRALQAYAEQGYPGEEQMHHQGGATGYWEREWIARPGGSERVQNNQAMAWNPSLQGAKVEDTVLLRGEEIEILTRTPSLAIVETSLDGRVYRSAGVLVA